jgi:drug/metabolite transporter (DMT)-like permease
MSLPGVAAAAPLRGIVFMVLATAFYAASDTLAKVMLADYSVLQVTWARYAFALVLVLPVFARVSPRAALTSARPVWQASRSLLMIVGAGVYFVALRTMPVADVTAIFYVEPLVLTAIAVPLLGEHVGRRRWIGVGVGFCGMLLIIRPGSGALDPVALLPFVAAVMFALYQVTTRLMSARDRPFTTYLYLVLTGTVVMSCLAPFDWTAPDLRGWLLFALHGTLGGFAQLFLIGALSAAPASALAPFRYGQLIFATIGGLVVFGHVPDATTGAGMLVIAGAGLYVWARERRAQAAPTAG